MELQLSFPNGCRSLRFQGKTIFRIPFSSGRIRVVAIQEGATIQGWSDVFVGTDHYVFWGSMCSDGRHFRLNECNRLGFLLFDILPFTGKNGENSILVIGMGQSQGLETEMLTINQLPSLNPVRLRVRATTCNCRKIGKQGGKIQVGEEIEALLWHRLECPQMKVPLTKALNPWVADIQRSMPKIKRYYADDHL